MKMIKVSSCGDCDNCKEGPENEYHCIHTQKRIINLDKIDEDCTLEDVK